MRVLVLVVVISELLFKSDAQTYPVTCRAIARSALHYDFWLEGKQKKFKDVSDSITKLAAPSGSEEVFTFSFNVAAGSTNTLIVMVYDQQYSSCPDTEQIGVPKFTECIQKPTSPSNNGFKMSCSSVEPNWNEVFTTTSQSVASVWKSTSHNILPNTTGTLLSYAQNWRWSSTSDRPNSWGSINSTQFNPAPERFSMSLQNNFDDWVTPQVAQDLPCALCENAMSIWGHPRDQAKNSHFFKVTVSANPPSTPADGIGQLVDCQLTVDNKLHNIFLNGVIKVPYEGRDKQDDWHFKKRFSFYTSEIDVRIAFTAENDPYGPDACMAAAFFFNCDTLFTQNNQWRAVNQNSTGWLASGVKSFAPRNPSFDPFFNHNWASQFGVYNAPEGTPTTLTYTFIEPCKSKSSATLDGYHCYGCSSNLNEAGIWASGVDANYALFIYDLSLLPSTSTGLGEGDNGNSIAVVIVVLGGLSIVFFLGFVLIRTPVFLIMKEKLALWCDRSGCSLCPIEESARVCKIVLLNLQSRIKLDLPSLSSTEGKQYLDAVKHINDGVVARLAELLDFPQENLTERQMKILTSGAYIDALEATVWESIEFTIGYSNCSCTQYATTTHDSFTENIEVIVLGTVRRMRNHLLGTVVNRSPPGIDLGDTSSAESKLSLMTNPVPYQENGDSKSSDPPSPSRLIRSKRANVSDFGYLSQQMDRHSSRFTGGSGLADATRSEVSFYTEFKLERFSFIPLEAFEVGPEIGRGVGGIAIKAKYNDNMVVIKVPRGSSHTKDVWKEFLASVDIPPHKNVLELIGITSVRHRIALVSPFCELGSLDKLHKRFDMGERLFFRHIAKDVCSGVAHLHINEIIQRDIACRNLLMKGDRTVVLADWGLARKLEASGTYDGTNSKMSWPWSAPESLLSLKFSFKSDIWMVGVTFWELLSRGKDPYDYKDQDAYLAKVEIVRGKLVLADTPVSADTITIHYTITSPKCHIREETQSA